MKLWYKYYHLLYLVVCWIKAKDIKSLEMPCNLSCWCVIRMFFLTMLFLTTWGIYMLMNLTWRWRNLWCAWNTNYYEFLHLSYEQKRTEHLGLDVGSQIQDHVAFHYLCGLYVTLVLVATYDKWLLLPLLVECYKFLMLIMFDEPLSQVAMNNEDLFSLTNILKLVLWELD